MSSRKRTFSNKVNDFFRNSNLQDEFNISSYSSSEEENATKKFEISVLASQNNFDESLKISVDSSLGLCNISSTFEKSQDVYDSIPSPVIGTGKLDRLSPVLKCSYRAISADLSPIIGRRQTWSAKRIKSQPSRKFKLVDYFSIPEKDNEVQETEDCKIVKPTCSTTSVDKSSDENVVISSFSSDNLDKIIINSATTDTSSAKSLNDKPLYQETSPKKKKRYKKGGLAFQLKKALDKQKSDFSIFRHELFLSKSNERIVIDESLMMIVKINKIWKEFGVTMIYSDYLNLQENANLVNHFRNQSTSCGNDVDLEKCLLTVGCNVTHNLNIKEGAKLKVYLPFKSKVIKYNKIAIYCHFNVFKIFSEK